MKRVKLLTERTLREKKYLLRGKYSKTSQLIVPPTLLSETISFEGESSKDSFSLSSGLGGAVN